MWVRTLFGFGFWSGFGDDMGIAVGGGGVIETEGLESGVEGGDEVVLGGVRM